MAQTDYMKRDDEGRAQQFIGFRDNIPAHLSTLGLLATDRTLSSRRRTRRGSGRW